MKQTQTNQTLFQALCTKFISKNGNRKAKASVAPSAVLLAERDAEGAIQKINMIFKDKVLMEVPRDLNTVTLHAPGNEFSRIFQTRLNKVLSLIRLTLENGENGTWSIVDSEGTRAAFKNHEVIDLNRPYGQAIYAEQAE